MRPTKTDRWEGTAVCLLMVCASGLFGAGQTRWHLQQILIAQPTGELLSKGINASQEEESQEIWGQLANLNSHVRSHNETAGLGDLSVLSPRTP